MFCKSCHNTSNTELKTCPKCHQKDSYRQEACTNCVSEGLCGYYFEAVRKGTNTNKFSCKDWKSISNQSTDDSLEQEWIDSLESGENHPLN